MPELRLHVYENDDRSIADLVANAKLVFKPLDIQINVVANEKFNALTDVDTKTSDVAKLRTVATSLSRVVPVFYLLTVNPSARGVTLAGPLVLIGAEVTLWTLAHELGHALGLQRHSTEPEEVMGPTTKVHEPPPDFTGKELEKMLKNDLLVGSQSEASLSVNKEDVLAFLQYDDPDYEEAAALGRGALPHLSEFVENADADPALAAAAVYLAAKIGKAEAAPIVTSAAHPSRPRSVRVSAAVAAAFLPAAQNEAAIISTLDTDDHGLRKMALRSVNQGASKALLDRLQKIAAEEPDEALRRLAVDALMRQM